MSSTPASDALSAVLGSTAQASGLPNDVYTSDAFFERERDTLLARTWACVGRGTDAPAPGDVCPVDLMGLPLVMGRGDDGHLRVFHNVCSHHGNRLVAQACRVTGVIRCPYHSWTYRLDGKLRGTPHIGGVGKHELAGFDHDKHGLRPVRSHVWLDLVFVNLSETAPEFEDHIAPLRERWRAFVSSDDLAALRIGASHADITMEINADWKMGGKTPARSIGGRKWLHILSSKST